MTSDAEKNVLNTVENITLECFANRLPTLLRECHDLYLSRFPCETAGLCRSATGATFAAFANSDLETINSDEGLREELASIIDQIIWVADCELKRRVEKGDR